MGFLRISTTFETVLSWSPSIIARNSSFMRQVFLFHWWKVAFLLLAKDVRENNCSWFTGLSICFLHTLAFNGFAPKNWAKNTFLGKIWSINTVPVSGDWKSKNWIAHKFYPSGKSYRCTNFKNKADETKKQFPPSNCKLWDKMIRDLEKILPAVFTDKLISKLLTTELSQIWKNWDIPADW